VLNRTPGRPPEHCGLPAAVRIMYWPVS